MEISAYHPYDFSKISRSMITKSMYQLGSLQLSSGAKEKCSPFSHLSFLTSQEAKHLSIPQYEGLEIEAILEKLRSNKLSSQYLPDKQDEKRLPKQWLVNLAYSLFPEDFCKWVKKKIEDRNQRLAVEHNLMIAMDPQVAEAFMASTAISRKSGVAVNMLKAGIKRRRTVEEIQQDLESCQIPQREILEKLKELEQLKKEKADLKQQAESNLAANQILSNLLETGQAFLNDDGSVSVNPNNQSKKK